MFFLCNRIAVRGRRQTSRRASALAVLEWGGGGPRVVVFGAAVATNSIEHSGQRPGQRRKCALGPLRSGRDWLRARLADGNVGSH